MMWKKQGASIADSRLQFLFPISMKWPAKPCHHHTEEWTVTTETRILALPAIYLVEASSNRQHAHGALFGNWRRNIV